MKSPHLLRYLYCPLALGVLACSGSKSDADKSVAPAKPPEPGAFGEVAPDRAAKFGNTKASNVGVELLEPGKEPRAPLRYEVKPNYVAVASSRTTIKNGADKSVLRDSSFVLTALVDSVDGESFSVTYVIQADQDGKLIDDPDRMGEADAQAFGGTVKYSDQGRPTGFEPFADDQALSKQYQGEVMGLMNAPWLPAKPVGVGAKWQIHTPVSVAQPIRSVKEAISELVSVEGSVVTIETTTTTDAPKQTVNGKEIEGQTVRSTKRTKVDLADPVSVLPGAYNLSQEIEQTLKKAGVAVTQRMSTTATSTRIGDAVASE